VQSAALLRLGAALRATVWALCAHRPARVTVNIGTTVSTVYGAIEGARKGHNPKHRGKKGLRPVLCFLAETREYLCGTQRRGETITTREVARQIRQFRKLLPPHVQAVRVHGDGECIGWDSVQACRAEGFSFTFGNQPCAPPFPEDGWYRHGDHEDHECEYQPQGWEAPCRFVAMRIRQDQGGERQLKLLEQYVYRVFATNAPGRPPAVIAEYDQRADVENLWRWMKLLAGHAEQQAQEGKPVPEPQRIRMPDHTLRIARLKLLYMAAKIRFHANRDAVLYSMHAQRAAGLMDFLGYLDRRRKAA